MADIFLSYAREDVAKAKLLATALEKHGWSVFWDRTSLRAGDDFDVVIEQAVDQAKCMIVCWSSASRNSDWVRGEATIGREHKILVPVLFEAVSPPIAFRSLHTESFVDWQGDVKAPAYLGLCSALEQRIKPGASDRSYVVDKPQTNTTQKTQSPQKPNSFTPINLKKYLSLRNAMLALVLMSTLTIWQSGVIGKSKFTFLIEDKESPKEINTDNPAVAIGQNKSTKVDKYQDSVVISPPSDVVESTSPKIFLRESFEFNTGSNHLPITANPRLLEIANQLKKDSRNLKIVGHTDNIGSSECNDSDELGLRPSTNNGIMRL